MRERTASTVRHPWESARVAHIAALLRARGVTAPGVRVLDAGAGDSFLAASLAETFPGISVTCWDINYSHADLADSPPGARRTASRPSGPFDVVLALDVIEHVHDDAAFLEDLRALSHAGTLLVVTVPAYQSLFSEHDVYLRHYRRYSRDELAEVLTASGWTALRLGGFFSSLLPVRAAAVLTHRVLNGAVQPDPDVNDSAEAPRHLGSWDGSPLLTRAVGRVLAADAAAGRWAARRRPFGVPGLSLFAEANPTPVRGAVR